MKMDHVLAMRSPDGEILIADQTDNFSASFRDSKWRYGDIFDSEDLFENFRHIEDDDEVLRILKEARSTLTRI